MGEIEPGETVVVFGCGPVGLFAMQRRLADGRGPRNRRGPRALPARVREKYARVETLNFKEDRRNHRDQGDDRGTGRGRLHRRGGDGGGGLGDDSERSASAGRWRRARRGARLVHPCSPQGRQRLDRSASTARRGTCVDIGTAMNKGLTLRMNQCNVHRYMPHLLEHIRAGRIDAKGIITHRFPLDEAPTATTCSRGSWTAASSALSPGARA